MTPEQITLVKTSFEKVAPIADKAAALFYDRLFEIEPSVKPLFKEDIEVQGRKLMAAIGAAVKGLDNLDSIVPFLQKLGRGHVKYGVKDEHYDVVGAALLWTLEQGLGDDFTDEVKEAWTTAYTLIATTMKDAANAA